MWELGVIAITSLQMGFVNLPDTAYSYDGTARDISQFYRQSIPTTTVGYLKELNDTNYITGYVSSGIYSEKYDVYPTVGFTLNNIQPITDKWDLTTSLASTLSGGYSHSPCADSYNREYYCANLTAWSDFNDKKENINVSINEIRISLSTRW